MRTYTLKRPSPVVRKPHRSRPLGKRRPPNPDAWLCFLCQRCGRFFRVQGISRHCGACLSAAAKVGLIGSESLGEVSGT